MTGMHRLYRYGMLAKSLISESFINSIILETDAQAIAQRVSLKTDTDIPLTEQTVSQALQTAKDQITKVIMKA